ncbi:type II secretion system protein [Candidatus Nomurabacteria bacterium]|nr:type II secretion system protein [Candidatus Nomurabacteria bacterium]
MINKFHKNGFTLVEILVVTAIIVIVSLVLVNFQIGIFRQNNFLANSLTGEQDARLVIGHLVAELREAVPSEAGAYPITLADKDRLTFYSDVDHDGLHDRLRYFLATTTLMRGVLKPTGAPLVYVEGNEKISPVITNVVNPAAQIFSYYDQNYAGTSTALTLPLNIPDVRLVKVSLMIEADPNRSPAPVTYEGQVSIRSLKDNL